MKQSFDVRWSRALPSSPKTATIIKDTAGRYFVSFPVELEPEVKASWHGRELVKIDRWFPSSKTCSSCQHVLETLPLDVHQWQCPSCGETHDRDINAAINVKCAAGLAVQACGDSDLLVERQLSLF